MKQFLLVLMILAIPVMSFGQVKVIFSHQSVGRHVVADPERAVPELRADIPIRDRLDANVAFWDHDYYNYSRDGVFGSLLDSRGSIYPNIQGFGGHRGSDSTDVLLDHLVGNAFCDIPVDDLAKAFRDSCVSRFDIVMIKPGYRDLHMNTTFSLEEYKIALNESSDWWHAYNLEHGTNKVLVVMTGSSLRHPSDYDIGTAGWTDTVEGRAEAEADVAAYRQLDLWFQSEWVNRNPENRYFSTFEFCVNLEGTPEEKFFTKDIYTGSGAGDSSGDHHLNKAGSNALQNEMVAFINALADDYENGGTSTAQNVTMPPLTLFNPCPNPFNPTTAIAYEITDASPVQLSIFDVSGKRIVTLVNETRQAGRHEVLWSGKDSSGESVASGVYVVRIESNSSIQTTSITLVK